MRTTTFTRCCIYMLLAPLLFARPGDDEQSKLRRVVDISSEKSIYAKINIGSALMYINRVDDSHVFAGEFIFTSKPPLVDYEIVGDEGRLSVKFTDKHKKQKHDDSTDDDEYDIQLGNLYKNECYLNFSDRIPLTLNMDLGVIKGDLDLGGLRIADCDMNTAVSTATINFSRPNLAWLERMHIENGVGKMQLYNLCNANFGEFSFNGGVGSYVLDFGGELRENALVDIELGMGRLVLYLPRKYGVRIRFEDTIMTSLRIDESFRKGNYYYNDRWDREGTPRLDLEIDASAGRVEVEWLE